MPLHHQTFIYIACRTQSYLSTKSALLPTYCKIKHCIASTGVTEEVVPCRWRKRQHMNTTCKKFGNFLTCIIESCRVCAGITYSWNRKIL